MAKQKSEPVVEPTEENTKPEGFVYPSNEQLRQEAESTACKYRVTYNLSTPPHNSSVVVEAENEAEAIRKANEHFGIIKPAKHPSCSKC